MMKEKRFKFEDEAIGFVYPCYGFEMPKLAEYFILKPEFKADYFFAVMTYGNIAGDGPGYLAKIAAKAGVKFNYANEILMTDNCLHLFDMEKQLAAEEGKNIETNLYLIESDIKSRKNFVKRKNPLVKFFSKPVNFYAKKLVDDIDENFIVTGACVKCGICAKVCPKNNIVVKEKPQYLHKCDYCMVCVQLCPAKAIRHKKEKNSARFKNQHITLKEIIDANSPVPSAKKR